MLTKFKIPLSFVFQSTYKDTSSFFIGLLPGLLSGISAEDLKNVWCGGEKHKCLIQVLCVIVQNSGIILVKEKYFQPKYIQVFVKQEHTVCNSNNFIGLLTIIIYIYIISLQFPHAPMFDDYRHSVFSIIKVFFCFYSFFHYYLHSNTHNWLFKG